MESQTGKGSSSNRGSRARRLSMTNKKSQKVSAIKERTSNGGGVASITSFFRNTPPCKLACPLCGKLVPRYKINEHIDSQCQTFLGEDHEDALAVSDDKRGEITKTPSNGASQNDGIEKDSESPHFKKNCVTRQDSTETNLQAKPVKTVGLGSLSSKLSRRALRLSGESEMDHSHVSGKEATHDAVLSSSQNENYMKSSTFKPKAGGMDTDNTFPTDPAASNHTQVKNMEKCMAGLAESRDIQSVKSSSSSRVLKRKSDEFKNDTNTTETSVMHKKSRYFQSKSEKGHETNVKSDQTEASSDVVPLTESKIKSKTTNKNIERKPDTTPANESKVLDVEKVSEGSEHQHLRLPYYLQNFQTVLEAVLENEDDRMLFNEEDFSTIHTFQQLSGRGTTLKSQFCSYYLSCYKWKQLFIHQRILKKCIMASIQFLK